MKFSKSALTLGVGSVLLANSVSNADMSPNDGVFLPKTEVSSTSHPADGVNYMEFTRDFDGDKRFNLLSMNVLDSGFSSAFNGSYDRNSRFNNKTLRAGVDIGYDLLNENGSEVKFTLGAGTLTRGIAQNPFVDFGIFYRHGNLSLGGELRSSSEDSFGLSRASFKAGFEF